MTSAFSWKNSISLCPVSFCTLRPNLPVRPGVSWLPTFAFLSPIMKRTSSLGVLKGLVVPHRTVQLQLLQHYWLGHRLGLPWYWMVCLGNKQRSFCHFWDFTQVLHFGLFCWLCWLVHFFFAVLSQGQLSGTPWTVAHQPPLSMGFSRQEYWSGWPIPSPGDLPNSGIEPGSPTWQAVSLLAGLPGKPKVTYSFTYIAIIFK